MPITRHQKLNAVSRRSTSPAKASHFFKLVHSAMVKNQNLRIPPKFVRKYAKNLPNTVFVKVPSDAKWRMGLKKCGGKVYLDRGWQDFADYYSIVFGHVLVFRYDGDSCFHVRIFDPSACEIEYPFNKNHGEEIEMEEYEDDVSVEVMDDFPSKSGAKGSEKRQAYASATNKVGARERANEYKSKNPRFIVTMRRSYMDFRLYIPLAFVGKYFTEKHNNVHLRVAEKTWSVKCRRGSNLSNLYDGWRKFTKDNQLRVGDVCVFELIKDVENSLEVVIFRRCILKQQVC